MKQLAKYLFLGVLAVLALFPLFYVVVNSFIGSAEFSRYYGGLGEGLTGFNPLRIIPDWISAEGYREVFYNRPHFLMRFWYSVFLSGSILAGQLVIAVLGGYAFARFRFPGRSVLFFVIVLIMMMPLQVTLVPNLIIVDRLGLHGTYGALILPGIFSAFGVFLMRQVMKSLPNSIFESAKLDGAGSFAVLLRMCLPNCKHGLAALAVLNFADSWNMVEQPLVFLRYAHQYPLAVYLVGFTGIPPEVVFTSGLLSVLPVLMLFLWFKDEIAFGMEYSVVK
ncbi:MAG: carbohydrate ABC transporter permease [Defluviitaleaceae bacterium]|nr:carbohydrate ABC transporter permease [Defluviitaleaceae bacterium]